MARRASSDADRQHHKGSLGINDHPRKIFFDTRESAKIMRNPAPFNTNGKAKEDSDFWPVQSAGRRTNVQERRSSAKHHDEQSESISSRTASFFRLSRASFSNKKPMGGAASDESASPAPTTSFESQRSTTSAGSSSGPGTRESRTQSQTSSPLIYRSNQTDFWRRPSVSSSREGEWISDMDGNRVSLDFDGSAGHSGRPWPRMDRSTSSLSSELGAEDSEVLDTFQSANTYASSISPKSIRPRFLAAALTVDDRSSATSHARLKPSRSISAFTAMKRIGSEDTALSRMRSRVSLHHTPSTPSLRDHYNAPISRLPLPPLPKFRSPRTPTIQEDSSFISSNRDLSKDYEIQKGSLMVPSSSSSSKTLRKTKSQNSFRELMRKSSFVISSKSRDDHEEADDEQRRVNGSLDDSSEPSVCVPPATKEKTERNVRKSIFRYGKARADHEVILGLTSSSRSSLISADFNSPLSSSPVQERLQPFLSTSSSRESLSVSSDHIPYSSLAPPLLGRDRERSASAATSRHASPSGNSRLQANGGAASLFTTKNQRQRAASLLPSMSWRTKGQGTSTKLSTAPSKTTTLDSTMEQNKKTSIPKVDIDQFYGNAEEFVAFVLATIPRDKVAAVIASSSDDIHKQGLAHYMQRFNFASDPLDIALRKLLMTLCLPKETQQIDRVMEAFAQRYNDCNEGLFESVDQPYVLAFSLMMLHTDAFNKNAKQKMSKMEYIRNTSSCGVPADILEYLYDNLTFTQFIYVDEDEMLSRRKSEGESSASASLLSALSTTSNGSSTKSRIDPYHIIANGLTHSLCANVSTLISKSTPFATTGTNEHIDIDRLNQTFVNAPTIEIITTRRASLPSSSDLDAGASFTNTTPHVEPDEEVVVTLRVTKIGCVSRKDDIVEEDKKASSRRWKTCGMMLSSTQLLFFKDLVWTGALHQQIKEQSRTNPPREGGVIITPRLTHFRPDGVLALSDVIAVHDKSYTKYQNVLRLFAKQGQSYRQYLIQAASEDEMNDWIQRINFCAAFRACGLKIRGVDLPTTPSPDKESMGRVSMSLSTTETRTARTSSSSLQSARNSKESREESLSSSSRHFNWMIHARRSELMPKLDLINTKCIHCQKELDRKLRLGDHLGVLTPFMKVTRDKIENNAISLARQIRAIRLELAKYQSRKQILTLELEAGDRALKGSDLAMALVDISATEDLDDEPVLPLSLSLDQLSLPTPSSSFSIYGSATSRSSIGSTSRLPAMTTSGLELEHDAATPRVKSSQMSLPDDAVDGRSESGFEVAKMDGKLNAADPQLQVASSLQGLGLNDLIDDAALTFHHSERHQPEIDFKVPHNWTRTIINHSLPREEAERWDRSRVVRDAKRVSLATLPDAEHLMDISRVSLLYASGAKMTDEE